jgi:aminomethyltransferase
MKKSPFHDLLNRRNAGETEAFLAAEFEDVHFINWNNFVLPLNYRDAEREYRALRDACALFDITPLRKYRIQGSGAGEFLDHLLTRPASDRSSMHCLYVIFCNEDGSLKDDAILHKYAEDDYLLLPSDMDHAAHFAALIAQNGIEDVSISECTDSVFGLALQGPASATALHSLGMPGIETLEPFAIRDYSLFGGTLRVARMGFTGDLGYEVWMAPGLGASFSQGIQMLRETRGMELPGYGLTTLETCRLESGFIVAGWDCATEADPQPGFERSPFELGLDWLVNLDAAEFPGRQALQEQRRSGCKHVLRSFLLADRRKPADGTELFAEVAGEVVLVGTINCSSWSWDLERMIGNASVFSEYRDLEQAWTSVQGDKLRMELSQGALRRFAAYRQVPAPILL